MFSVEDVCPGEEFARLRTFMEHICALAGEMAVYLCRGGCFVEVGVVVVGVLACEEEVHYGGVIAGDGHHYGCCEGCGGDVVG